MKLLFIFALMFASTSYSAPFLYKKNAELRSGLIIIPTPSFGAEINTYSIGSIYGGLSIKSLILYYGDATAFSITPRIELGPDTTGYTLKLTTSHMSDVVVIPALSIRGTKYKDYDGKGEGESFSIGYDHHFSMYVGAQFGHTTNSQDERKDKRGLFFSIGFGY